MIKFENDHLLANGDKVFDEFCAISYQLAEKYFEVPVERFLTDVKEHLLEFKRQESMRV